MTKMQSSTSPAVPARRSSGPAKKKGRAPALARETPADHRILVEHDLISQADLDALNIESAATGVSVFQLLTDKGVYSAEQIDLCLSTDNWLKRSTAQHIDRITSEEAIAAYQHGYALNGFFQIPHFLPREQLYALDLALQKMVVDHVNANPVKHKSYHSLGGSILYSQQAMVDLIGHPALTRIAQAFLGDDLVQGKYYVKVDDPYQYRGMFGHTHAEIPYDCLTRGLYMFLYMDSTGHDYGAFQIIPGSHEWYSRGTDGRTLYQGRPLDAESPNSTKASLVHAPEPARRWAGYESLTMPGNTLLVLSPFIWHAVRPALHRRRLIFTGFFDAKAMTRDFVQRSDYFGAFPYDLNDCDLALLTPAQTALLSIHLDRETWLGQRGL